MKKRMLSLLIVMAMLITAIYVPVSASVGKLPKSGQSVADYILSKNSTEKTYTGTGSIAFALGGTGNQHNLSTYAIDADSDEYYGALSFRIKADEANNIGGTGADRDYGFFIIQFRSDESTSAGKIKETNIVILDYTGYMRGINTTTNSHGLQTGTLLGSDWHTVGVVFKKDNSYDVFINGVFQENFKLADADYSNTSHIRLLLNAANEAKYYVDELTWSKYSDNSFISENADGKNVYNSGNTVKVKFSEIIASQGNIKLYNVATGEEVSGATSSYDGEYLSVVLPSGLTPASEYRIEMNDFVGAFGRTLETDNIYFNCAMGSGEPGATQYVKADSFEEYKNTTSNAFAQNATNPNTNYYQPTGWNLKQRWLAENAGVVMAQATGDSHGTAMQVGKTVDASSTGKGKSSKPGVYLPFGEKISTGILTISYDMKPQYLSKQGQYSDHINANLLMMVYPNEPTGVNLATSGDSSKIQECDLTNANTGRPIAGIVGYDIGSAKGNINEAGNRKANSYLLNVHKTLTMTDVETEIATAYPYASWEKVSGNDWYNVKVEFNFDEGKIIWYLDGEKMDENSTLMTDFGLTGGITGLSFGQGKNNNSALCLIDNVSVTKTLANKLAEKDYLMIQDFDSFENNDENGNKLWSAIEEDGVEAGYGPEGWGVHQIWATGSLLRQYGTIIKADKEGKDGTNALKFGKQIINAKSKDEAPALYYKFDKAYDSGVFDISYDLKADKLAGSGNEAIETAIASAGGTLSGWGLAKSDSTPIAPRQFEFGVVKDEISAEDYKTTSFSNNLPGFGSSNGKYQGVNIFGIQNNKFASFTSPRYVWLESGAADYESCKGIVDGVQYWGKATYRKDVTEDAWYSVRHIIDLDNDLITTFVDGVAVAIVPTSSLDLETISAIRLGGDTNMYGTEIVVDNVQVTRAEYEETELAGGVMQVRFADYFGNKYGTASTHTTLTDAIGISFWINSLDEYSFDSDTVALIDLSDNSAVDYTGSFEGGAYVMSLDDYLTKNTSYKLIVNGVTANGRAIPYYEQIFNTDENGEFIVEPMIIKHNGTAAQSGTLAENDTVTASVYVINTTGEEKDFAFSMGVYDTGVLRYFDFEEVTLDGTKNKSALLETGLTVSKDDAENVTKVKTFLWDGMDTIRPIIKAEEFTANK